MVPMQKNTNDHAKVLYHELLLHFLADLLTATIDTLTPEAFQQATQAFCTALESWLDPADLLPQPRPVFCLLTECTVEGEGKIATVRLSPSGEAYFRAWARRQAVLIDARVSLAQERSH